MYSIQDFFPCLTTPTKIKVYRVHRVHTVYIIAPNSIWAIYHPTSFLRPNQNQYPWNVSSWQLSFCQVPRILPNKSLEKSNKPFCFVQVSLTFAPSFSCLSLSGGHGGWSACLSFMGEISGLAHQVLTHNTPTSGPIAASPLAPAVPQGAARPRHE